MHSNNSKELPMELFFEIMDIIMHYVAFKEGSCIIMNDVHYLFHSIPRIKKVTHTNDAGLRVYV